MRRQIIFFGVIGLLVVGFSLGWLWQRGMRATLIAELENRRSQSQERTRMESEHAQLLSRQISAAQLEDLRSDHAALVRLRNEMQAAKQRVEEVRQKTEVKSGEPKPYEPSILDGPLPVSMWKNAGSATPAAVVETALWAAAGGDVESFARLLVFGAGAREKAVALLAELPASTRMEYDSPEKFVAFLTAKDVPLGSARLIDPKVKNGNDVWFVAQLSKTETGVNSENSRMVQLALRQEGESWKLVVPASAVEKYIAQLKAPAGSLGTGK